MSLAEIETQIRDLEPEAQDRIAAFLTALRLKREGMFEDIRERLDDDSPENWISWEDAKKELATDEAEN